MTNKGKLFLIPTVIAENTEAKTIPAQVIDALAEIQHFLAEDVRTARRFLSSLKIYKSIEALSFAKLDKDTDVKELATFFDPIFNGFHLGVLSESGCPGVADPGALAVKFAHQHNIQVIPLTGPSSIILSLMASGLNGQKFCFHGYLPIDSKEASKAIRELEKESRNKHQTQIFIETPYRNNALFQNLIKNLDNETQVSVAIDLTGESENTLTKTVKQWKAQTFELPKMPAVFLFLA